MTNAAIRLLLTNPEMVLLRWARRETHFSKVSPCHTIHVSSCASTRPDLSSWWRHAIDQGKWEIILNRYLNKFVFCPTWSGMDSG